ncbi:MAG: hypothetical protein R3Y07_05245 [Eubacteriales bacterium]
MKKTLKKGKVALIILLSVTISLYLWGQSAKQNARWLPDYPKTDLTELLTKLEEDINLTSEEYDLLYAQTGIGEEGLDRLIQAGRQGELLGFQALYFAEIPYVNVSNTILTNEEYFITEQGERNNLIPLVPLQPGDILLTPSSHFLGWRQGHAAIVIDHETTLESVLLGQNSLLQRVGKWSGFPAVIVLSLKENSEQEGLAAAQIALEYLNDVPYDLTVGVFSKKDVTDGVLEGTHCSHLVWQSYQRGGIDLDSNGGLLPTPQDIARSPHLEVLQLWGVDPEKMWN